MITQEDEPTIAVPKKETPKPVVKTEVVKKDVSKKESTMPKEKTEAEKRAEAERLAAEKKAAEERAAAEAASKRIAGAFGKGTNLESKGTSAVGDGLQGTPTGNLNTICFWESSTQIISAIPLKPTTHVRP